MKNEIKEFKRNRILDKAAPLFAKFGFQNVTLDTIAKQLKVTKPFIYTYFASKDALLEALYSRTGSYFWSGAMEILASDQAPEEKLRMLVEFYVGAQIKSADLLAIFLTDEKYLPANLRAKILSRIHAFDTAFEDLIKEGIRQQVFEVADIRVASLSITGMIRWVHRWYSPTDQLPPKQIAQIMSSIALNIVGYRRGQQTAQRRRSTA